MSGGRVPWSRVQQELARARGSRRMLPWALLTAVGGGALGALAGGGVRGALALGAVGLVFACFLWVTSIARCPACGARLSARGDERLRGCPRCRATFD
jgi:hypothetical protein